MINHANHALFHYASDWPSQHIHVKVLLVSGVTSSATMSSKMLTASSQPWLSAHALIIGLYVRTSGLRPAAFKLLRKSSRSAPRKRLRFDAGGGTSKLHTGIRIFTDPNHCTYISGGGRIPFPF